MEEVAEREVGLDRLLPIKVHLTGEESEQQQQQPPIWSRLSPYGFLRCRARMQAASERKFFISGHRLVRHVRLANGSARAQSSGATSASRQSSSARSRDFGVGYSSSHSPPHTDELLRRRTGARMPACGRVPALYTLQL